MGEYKGKIMSGKSRYADYLPSLSASDREAIDARIDRLNAENRQYCDRGNYGHLCNIFTSIAIYDPLAELI